MVSTLRVRDTILSTVKTVFKKPGPPEAYLLVDRDNEK